MGKYILRRLIIALPSLLGISLILFVLLALAPGDPFGELATNSNIPPEVRAALRVKFGIDDPVFVRYLRWLLQTFDGNADFAVAAYNAGEGNVWKYNGVPPFRETINYVNRIAKHIKRAAGGEQRAGLAEASALSDR